MSDAARRELPSRKPHIRSTRRAADAPKKIDRAGFRSCPVGSLVLDEAVINPGIDPGLSQD